MVLSVSYIESAFRNFHYCFKSISDPGYHEFAYQYLLFSVLVEGSILLWLYITYEYPLISSAGTSVFYHSNLNRYYLTPLLK